jgi:hypothetical protein
MTLVNVFSEEYDEQVNYEDFLTLVERHGGDFGGHEFKFQQTASDQMRSGGLTTEHRELIAKVKNAFKQANGGIVGVEQAFRKFGSGGVSINFDQFLVALSRVDASLSMEEIKEFFALVQGNANKRSRGKIDSI